MAEDTYLDKSGYPIKNPNMELPLPDPSPKIDTGVNIDVSSSQTPTPASQDDTQKVDVAPVESSPPTVDTNPFGKINQMKKDEDLATYGALQDIGNVVKYISSI